MNEKQEVTMDQYYCNDCQKVMVETDGWLHRRRGHAITIYYTPKQRHERVTELRRLAAKAKDTAQWGAESLFRQQADALERRDRNG